MPRVVRERERERKETKKKSPRFKDASSSQMTGLAGAGRRKLLNWYLLSISSSHRSQCSGAGFQRWRGGRDATNKIEADFFLYYTQLLLFSLVYVQICISPYVSQQKGCSFVPTYESYDAGFRPLDLHPIPMRLDVCFMLYRGGNYQ